jgi:2-oxoglutarate/2-oxoacid ferredoxin oxidoreductase subunit beta
MKPEVVMLSKVSQNDLWIHDSNDQGKAAILSRMFENNAVEGVLPRPFGVLYREDRFCYEEAMTDQLHKAVSVKGEGDLDTLIRGGHTWTV